MNGGDRPDPTQWREALRWFAFAFDDLRLARLAVTDGAVLGGAAFHVQQATEKVLKALLVAKAADVRRVHDINELAGIAHRHWPEVIVNPFPLARVTAWYTVTRHPGLDDFSIGTDEVVAALDEVRALIGTLRELVPSDLLIESGIAEKWQDSNSLPDSSSSADRGSR
jgi:HEPN domain-containing protein